MKYREQCAIYAQLSILHLLPKGENLQTEIFTSVKPTTLVVFFLIFFSVLVAANVLNT